MSPKKSSKKTEDPTKELNPRQTRFVQEYLIDLNGTQSAIRAGYSKKTAANIAEENLRFYPYLAEKAISILAGKKEGFDFVFADPPYNFNEQEILEVIARIMESPLLKPQGTLILQHKSGLEKNSSLQKSLVSFALAMQTRRYGYTSLSFLCPVKT